MKKLLEDRIKSAGNLKDPAHVRLAALGIFRIAMQHACVTLGEWIVNELRNNPSRLSGYTSVDIGLFSQPADGALVNLMSQLFVAAENIGLKNIGRSYWRQLSLSEELKILTGTNTANLETVLGAFVRVRNDGGEGHGLPGEYSPTTDLAVVKALLIGVSSVLPFTTNDDDRLYMPYPDDNQKEELITLRLINGDPICYRKIRRVSAGKVRIEAQVQKTLLSRADASYEVPNILLDLPRAPTIEYNIYEPSWCDSWKPFVHIPDRLAESDVFTGRSSELLLLEEWIDDADSRKCMIWGDGGVGKTTLLVEFLHRLLEGNTSVAWRPEIITFYTAKKTRWGLQGLEHISALDIGVADVALDIARMLTTPNLDRSWFEKSPKEVIQKLASLLSDMGVSRDSHLIILDNTETMARSEEDIRALAVQINELSKRIGRIVLTSRRREHLEALPIQIENWSEEEGAEFLKKRGEILNSTPLQQAGNSTLKKYSRLLINKPIALEVLVQAATAPGISLENAFQRVQRMQRQDLGQFLYDDAWGRFSPQLRRVLLLMSRLGDAHDQYMMQLCCQRYDVTVAAASEAIEESRGIGTVTRFEGVLQIALNPEFYNYCIERFEQVQGKPSPSDEDVEWVRRRYNEFIVSASAQVYDRNLNAFRVPSARAAWKAFTENRIEDALNYYEIAEMEDPSNGWLFDRYAYALMKLRRLDSALEKAKKAVLLLPTESEVYFTKGMIESRIGDLDNALHDLDKSVENGKSMHLCELQKAYAYFFSSPRDVLSVKAHLDKAKRMAPKDKFLSKFIDEVTRLERKLTVK